MKILIRSYLAASYLLESEPDAWSAIAILDSGLAPTPFVSEHTQRHRFLYFDDITCADANKLIVQHSHLQQAIEFTANTEQLVVCCHAGQSRSAAMAYVLAYAQHGKSQALSLLNPTRHVPNSLVIQVGAEVLDMPEVVAHFQEWQRENQQFKLANYYDEIVAEVEELERLGARNRITT